MKNRLMFFLVLFLFVGGIFILWQMPLKLGLDLQGGTRLVVEAKNTKDKKVDFMTVQGVAEVIRNRIDSLGVAEPIIQRKGDRQVIIELPGIDVPDRAIKLIGETALLEFVEAEWPPAEVEKLPPEKIKEIYGAGARLVQMPVFEGKTKVGERSIILKKTALVGSDLKWAGPGADQFGGPVVNIEFNPQGTRLFGDVTTRSIGRPLAIILDGKIISAPEVKEPIPSGRAQISGNFTIQEVQDLVIKLRAGSLPVPVEVIESRTVGPTLGKDSIEKSKKAGLIGFLMVVVFMLAYYRLPGFLADIALVLYIILLLAVMVLLRATLTLPGIAGFILSIGMAVDANVIIFERLKDELRAGESMRTAIDLGFKKAFMCIFDSNLTTLMGTVVLFWLGTGSIKGFAVTLSLGILISMFTAITVTKYFMDLISGLRLGKFSRLVVEGDKK
jgi:preprotein translocase subunit SecD